MGVNIINLWQKNIAHLTRKYFKNPSTITPTTNFCKSERNTIVVCKKYVLGIYAIIKFHSVHSIR